MRTAAALVTTTVALAFAGIAAAAPPVLTSVGHVEGHPTATWTIPPGGETWVIQVATSPATGSDGDFFSENVVIHDVFFDQTTSWTDSGYPLRPGTYYIHVSAQDPCYWDLTSGCPVYEWSATLPLTIPAAAPAQESTDSTAAPFFVGGHDRLRLIRPASGHASIELKFRGCGGFRPYRLNVRQRRKAGGAVVAQSRFTKALGRGSNAPPALTTACRDYTVKWRLANRFFGEGWIVLAVRIVDSTGRASLSPQFAVRAPKRR